jgi:hypothetical protein
MDIAAEPITCLAMIIELFNRRQVVVADICIDDDASTRALLRWSNKDWMTNNNTNVHPTIQISKGKNQGKLQKRPDRGKLPKDILEPKFLADPNHRRKCWTGDLIALASAKVQEICTMTKMDTTRLGKNYGYMIRGLHWLPIDKYEDAGKAVIEYHFNNHDYCGPWCPRKSQTDAICKEKARYYRNKADKADTVLYKVLYEKIERSITLERLLEVSHGLDTQVNESFNQSASWFAPKNKVYCSSMSLTNRLSMALGINSLGVSEYFQCLYVVLGIVMTDYVQHYITVKDRTRLKRLEKVKTKEQKKLRLKRKFTALTNDEAKTKKERQTGAGTYKSGMNMADGAVDGYTLDDMKIAASDNGPTTNTRKNLVCPHCGQKGHSTTRSTKCLHHNGEPTGIAAAAALLEDKGTGPIATAARNLLAQAIRDMDNYDTFPLTDDPPSNVSLSAFLEDQSWSDDNDDLCVGTL